MRQKKDSGTRSRSNAKRRRTHKPRQLDPLDSMTMSLGQRKRLENQGVRAARTGPLWPPGTVVSVALRCKHRVRVEALADGHVPDRARCPLCLLWSAVDPTSARPPIRSGTRRVESEHVEENDGRTFTVKVLAMPKRARKAMRR